MSRAFRVAVLCLLASSSSPALAWVSTDPSSRRVLSRSPVLAALPSDCGCEDKLSRRSFMTAAATLISAGTASFVVGPAIAVEPAPAAEVAVDPLAAFGEQLQKTDVISKPQKWPQEAAHPLPSLSGSDDPPVPSGLQEALEQAKSKKQVDPRTHG